MQILKFKPLLKQTLWGGNKIIGFKNITSDMQNVGESWEISGVKDNETVVSDGPMKGLKLNDVVAEMREKLMGRENYERSATSSHCSSSSSMPAKTFPFRCTPQTR